jgi:cytochrome c-type biogenesis protein CcmH
MTTFLALAALIIVVAAIPLATPLLRQRRTTSETADRQAANIAILRDQLAELEHDRDEGSLSETDFEQAKKELQKRLLEEAAPEPQVGRESAPARKTAIALIVLLPLVALGGYGILGNPAALDPAAREPVKRVTAADIEGMVARLAARLEQNPDDPKGWVMLARSYKALGRYPEAAEAYGKGIKLVETDATLLADYAELLAMTGNGFTGKPSQLIDKALKLAPEDPQVLLLAGAAAGQRGDFKAAVGYWEKVLPQLEPGSEEAEALGGALAEARQRAGAAGKR